MSKTRKFKSSVNYTTETRRNKNKLQNKLTRFTRSAGCCTAQMIVINGDGRKGCPCKKKNESYGHWP